jgi:O-antigen/teichoic acid export membrane protein
MCQGLGLLIGTMLLAQLVVSAPVINVRLLSPGDPAAVGALLAAMVLVRVPLFVFTSLQVALLPGLARAVATGEWRRFRQLLARCCGIVTLLGLAFGVPGTVLGPWLVRVLFAARPVLGHADFAVLAVATLCYMIALVLGQAAMALSRHRDLLGCWLAGAVALVALTLGPGPVRLRVEAGYALGSLTVVIALALLLHRARRTRRTRRRSAPAAG